MMESARHRTQAFPAGVAASTMLHVLIAAYLVFWISRTAPVVDKPIDISKAIPILMAQRRLAPPEPPKPQPKVPPKPIPTPETIQTTAPQQAVEVPVEQVEPPPTPQEPLPVEQPQPTNASYDQVVRGIIERQKGYPREARMAGDQGVAIVKFTINRYGAVLIFTLEKRTGSSSLDAEVKRLMRRIQRFPALQDFEYPGQERITFTIPIGFSLQG